jgi:DNA-binding NarL/FixJ family response regulator
MKRKGSLKTESVLLVHNNQLSITGLRSIYSKLPGKFVFLSAKTIAEIFTILETIPVNYVTGSVDILYFNNIEKWNALKSKFTRTTFTGMVSKAPKGSITELMNAGFNGLISESADENIMANGIIEVHNSKLYYCPIILSYKNSEIRSDKNDLYYNYRQILSSLRSRQILFLTSYEYSIKQIARKLDLAEPTIELYRSRLMRAIGAKSMIGLAKFALAFSINDDPSLFNLLD